MENNRSTRVNINVTLGYFRAVNGRIVVLCISRVPEFIEFLPLVCLFFLNKNVVKFRCEQRVVFWKKKKKKEKNKHVQLMQTEQLFPAQQG